MPTTTSTCSISGRAWRFIRRRSDWRKSGARKRKTGSFVLVYLGDGRTGHLLELTQLHDRTEPYDLGDNEIHLAFTVDDYAAALAKHKEMGVVCFENTAMGIYFIEDPDGYWLEILPGKR